MMHRPVTCLTSHVSFVWLWRSMSHKLPARNLKAFSHFLSGNTLWFCSCRANLRKPCRNHHWMVSSGMVLLPSIPVLDTTRWHRRRRRCVSAKVNAAVVVAVVVVAMMHSKRLPRFLRSTVTFCTAILSPKWSWGSVNGTTQPLFSKVFGLLISKSFISKHSGLTHTHLGTTSSMGQNLEVCGALDKTKYIFSFEHCSNIVPANWSC